MKQIEVVAVYPDGMTEAEYNELLWRSQARL